MGVSFFQLDQFIMFVRTQLSSAEKIVVAGLPKSGRTTVLALLRNLEWKRPVEFMECTLSRQARHRHVRASDLLYHMGNREDLLAADTVFMTKKEGDGFWVYLEKSRHTEANRKWRIR